MKIHLPLCLLCIFLSSKAFCEDQRLTFRAQVNGIPTTLCIDTGAEFPLVIFSAHVNKLNLVPKKKKHLTTAEITLSIEGGPRQKTEALVIKSPPFIKHSGLVGWGLLKQLRFTIDWDTMTIGVLDSIPSLGPKWQQWKLDEAKTISAVRCKAPNDKQFILLDTGSPEGIDLRDKAWDTTFATTPEACFTLEAGYSPAAGGMYVSKVLLSQKFDLEGISMKNVLLERNAFSLMLSEEYRAILGIQAMMQFEFIFNGPEHEFYLKLREKYAGKLDYNRLGAVFAPATLADQALIAHVAPDSPAERAGIRPNDELIGIDDLDVTKWKTDPRVLPLSRFWHRKAGTRYRLKLRRGKTPYTAHVILADFLQKGKNKSQQQ